jgi:hypothetical protein
LGCQVMPQQLPKSSALAVWLAKTRKMPDKFFLSIVTCR